jgi:chemotaxis-related protein WspD
LLPFGPEGRGGVGANTIAETAAPGTKARLVVLNDRERNREVWVFEADEILGVHRIRRSQIRAVPSTLANPSVSYSQAVLSWKDRSVGYLDERRVFASLRSLNP